MNQCFPYAFSKLIKGAKETFSIDFTDLLGSGETITTGTVTCTDPSGTDPSPGNMISGSAQASTPYLLQLIDADTAGVAGVCYMLVFSANTSAGQIMVAEAYVNVVAQ